jgi:1-deoxy-D-xylulose-5-phosphate reductoisomerase
MIAIKKQNAAKNIAPKSIALFGATGTIGDNALSLISDYPHLFRASLLTAQENWQKLARLCHQFHPDVAVIANPAHYATLKEAAPATTRIMAGEDALNEAAALPCDAHLSAIVGFAALAPTFAAIQAGHTIILANKECLVAAGALLMEAVATHHAPLIPVDSEHSGLFQLWATTQHNPPATVTLTASGGALRDWEITRLHDATPAEAIAHPNWRMGAKISVDSATLMNKGLELIEAQHVFSLAPTQLDVLIHPESLVHCFITFADGAQLAQLSIADMRLPIAHALYYPHRLALNLPPLSLATVGALHFSAPDSARYPCLRLAHHAMQTGGATPLILNAANEIAVEAFLQQRIRFTDIAPLIEETLAIFTAPSPQTLDEVHEINHTARELTLKRIATWNHS